jgi:hypothetical protein
LVKCRASPWPESHCWKKVKNCRNCARRWAVSGYAFTDRRKSAKVYH